MAEILAGGTGHITHAPLSHSQTIDIAKFLQDQIKEIQGRLDDFQAEYSRTKEDMTVMQQNLRKDFDLVHSLQDGAASMGALLDATRKDLARTNGNAQQLSERQEEANKAISALEEARKAANMKMQKMDKDVQHCVSTCNDIRNTLEKQVTSEVQKTTDNLSKINLLVGHLKDDVEMLQEDGHKAREQQRTQSLYGQGMADDIQKTNSLLQMLDQRTGDIGRGLQKTRQLVDDHEHKHTKIDEDHDKMRNEVKQVAGGLAAVSSHVRQVSEELGKTSNSVTATQEQLMNTCMRLDHTGQELDITKNNVRSLKTAHEMASAKATDMASQLEKTKAIAIDTKKGLIDTNSLVLPNLNFDALSGGPRKPISARGDLPGARPVNLKPLPKKIASGTAQSNRVDVMAWI